MPNILGMLSNHSLIFGNLSKSFSHLVRSKVFGVHGNFVLTHGMDFNELLEALSHDNDDDDDIARALLCISFLRLTLMIYTRKACSVSGCCCCCCAGEGKKLPFFVALVTLSPKM
jgi:hypothetical protein